MSTTENGAPDGTPQQAPGTAGAADGAPGAGAGEAGTGPGQQLSGAEKAAAVAALAERIRGIGQRSGTSDWPVKRKADRLAEAAAEAAQAEAAAAATTTGDATTEAAATGDAAAETSAGTSAGTVAGQAQAAEAPARPSTGTAPAAAAAVRTTAAGRTTGRVPGAGAGGEAAAPLLDEQRTAALRAAAEVLTAGGAPADLAGAAVSEFGEGAAERLREDPWAVLGLPGVRPEHADAFARGLLGPAAGPGDPRRAQALAPWLLEQAALRGHSAVEIGEVAAGLDRLGLPDSTTALQSVVVDGRVMAFQEELAEPGAQPASSSADEDADEEVPTRTLLALERLALAEESLADGLVRLTSTFAPGTDPADGGAEDSGPADGTDDEAVDGTEAASDADGTAGGDAGGTTAPDAGPGPADWEAAAAAAPSSSAAALIRAVADGALVLHTGGEAARAEPAALLRAAAGLGLRGWAATWTEQGRDAFGAAGPDGGPGPDTVTLAELLSGTAGPGRTPDGTLALDVLVVLDAPLLDVELAATLLESLADGTRLVLSGDPGQLWSAGPGRFFADLAAARICPAVASRTPDFGPIGELVSGVGIGELQPVDAPDKEVVILTARDGGEAVHRAVQLLTDSIPRALGIPAEQVVLLTPGHGGAAGTRALNAAAKARLNPGPGRFGGFDPGDRVVDSPAPGVTRPARVLDGDATGLHLEYADGERRTVPPTEAARLRHGWALTVHQAVGRRWPGAVVVLPDDAAAGLTRQWVYTAFGRAERHLSVVHAAGPALQQAVAERPAQPRTTRLRSILAENAAAAQ